MATKEAPIRENVKRAILNVTERDTRLIMRPLRNTERVLVNAGVEKLLDIKRIKRAETMFDDIAEHVAGIYPRVMVQGEMDGGAWRCGLVAGLIHDVPSVGELTSRTLAEAQEIIGQRLPRFFPAEVADVPIA